MGDSQRTVQRTLGKPSFTGRDVDVFKDRGIFAYYDLDSRVRWLRLAHSGSGVKFTGKVYGIAIGDSVQQCSAMWGPPAAHTNTRYEWHLDKPLLG